MEHNHSPLKYGFLVSMSMLILGITFGYIGAGGSDFQSKVVIYTFAGIIVVLGTIILRKTFKKRDDCEICKVKYHYGKKKK